MKELSVAAVFSDNMVLQREKKVIVWGQGADGTEVFVSILGNTSKAIVENSKWEVSLPPMSAGGPYEMTVKSGDSEICFYNVMIGEVWLAGGQSNMELELQNCSTGEEDLANLSDVNVRFYYTPKIPVIDEKFEKEERDSGWGEYSKESARCWSAVAFYSAKMISENLGVTVGIIGCNWGGTSASAWMSRNALAEDKDTRTYIEDYENYTNSKNPYQHKLDWEEYQQYSKNWNEKYGELLKENPKASWDEAEKIIGSNGYPGPMGPYNECRPYGLYETMLSRVAPYTLRGFWYYQGESDDHKPDVYSKLLARLIKQWREDWRDDELPFGIVELPMFKYATDEDHKHWAKIREAQQKVSRTVKNTSLTVIIDCGELDNIHPTDKKTVGERLSLVTLNDVYHTHICSKSPMLVDFYTENDSMVLRFKNTYGGFNVKGESALGFELAGSDKEFFDAQAEFRGNEIIVKSQDVTLPIYARCNWTNFGPVTVYNKAGFPLSTFRTDKNDEK